MPTETLTRPAAQEPPLSKMLLSADDLRELGIRYSRAQLHKMVARGGFPRPIKISTHRSAWVASEIDAWLEARMAERAA